MSAYLRCECDRIDCDAVDVVELEAFDAGLPVREAMPDGWRYVFASNGLDKVLRCPDHAA